MFLRITDDDFREKKSSPVTRSASTLKERGAGLVDLFLNKMRDDEKTDAAALTFRLVSVEIGVDNFGHAATSAVVELHLPGARMMAADDGDDQPELPAVPPSLRDVRRLELRELHEVFARKGVGVELAMAEVRAGVHADDVRAGRAPTIDRTLKRWLDTLIQLDLIGDNGGMSRVLLNFRRGRRCPPRAVRLVVLIPRRRATP